MLFPEASETLRGLTLACISDLVCYTLPHSHYVPATRINFLFLEHARLICALASLFPLPSSLDLHMALEIPLTSCPLSKVHSHT